MSVTKHRGFCFTWNNPPVEAIWTVALTALDARYCIAGREMAASGTPHLQGFLYFKNARSQRATRVSLPACHVEPMRGSPAQAAQYCRKEDSTPFSYGAEPATQSEKGQSERDRYEQAWHHAKAGRIEEIDADIRLRQYGTIKRIALDYAPVLSSLPHTCGLWIHGLSGAGKSRAVLDSYPDCYPKPRNKWWDGYAGQPIILLDDVDVFDVALGGMLKHWADHYPFIAEIKGGGIKIRPQRLIVTSQYQIADIWSDEKTQSALLRRFVVVEKIIGQEINILN